MLDYVIISNASSKLVREDLDGSPKVRFASAAQPQSPENVTHTFIES